MRSVFWLKYVAALLLSLSITMVVYLNLPESGLQSSKRNHVISNGLSRDHIFSKQTSFTLSSHSITVIIREYEDFENALSETVEQIEKSLGDDIQIIIVGDTFPYPPINLTQSRSARIVTLASDLSKNYSISCPLALLKTQYVLFLPDGVKMDGWSGINRATAYLSSSDDIKAVAIGVGNDDLECSALDVNLKEWTVSFQRNVTKKTSHCSYVQGIHAILIKTENLKSLAEPFANPFPYTFYIQAVLRKWNIHIMTNGTLTKFRYFFQDFHSKWKYKKAHSERLHKFYKRVSIKREVLSSGISNYYGCTKKTDRCFGTVINDMPQYLYEGKWTPPCCLKALRENVAHVFGILDKCKARYWLEGGSLLGAARHGDIIPWDYDVDIGIYQEDLKKCHHLRQAEDKPYVDDEEYVWEKASEGEFYRVQYSETNHLHMDIFPFYSKNGVMTKNTWFETHPQDTEFPESFLIPLTKIKFAGVNANAPNNVRKFLEYKFGKDVIEKPRYPNLQHPVL